MPASLSPLACALLIQADYRDPTQLQTVARLEIGGVEARIVYCGDQITSVLIISGTNERGDWHSFNMRWWPKPSIVEGDTRRWHRGFMRNSEVCFSFAKGWLLAGGKIDFVTGHSLGAAAGQIVGSSLRIPTLAFASPKPLWSSTQPAGHELVCNWCRTDDLVTKVPPLNFNRVGTTIWLEPLETHVPRDHSIEGYIAILRGREPVEPLTGDQVEAPS